MSISDPLNQKVWFSLYANGPDNLGREGFLGIKVVIPGRGYDKDQFGIVISQSTLRAMGLVIDLMPGEKKNVMAGDLEPLAAGVPPATL